jgi:hypothetical protein
MIERRILPSILLSILFAFLLLFSISCNRNSKTEKEDTDEDTLEITEDFDQAKQIFYSLPAPHEVASILIENQEAGYNGNILNPVTNAVNYNTNKSMALNLGIYSADLSYASLFEQNQTVINYMATAKKLATELGIFEAFGEETIKDLEANINNRDAIINIISETFMDSDAYLQENNRGEIAAMIIIGGWIEGMYIAVELSEKKTNENELLVSRILEQQLSLSLMVSFLETYKENQSIADLFVDIQKLNETFESCETNVSETGDLVVSQADFTKICAELVKLRNKFVEQV